MRPRERGRGDDLAFVFGFGLALPLQVAANVWTGLGLACAALALRALLRAHLPGLSALHGLMGFALLASQPGAATFYSGQFGFLLVAAISAAAVLLREGRPSAAGLASLAFPAKPQYFVLAGWALLRAAHARGQARFALPAVGGSAAGVVAKRSRRTALPFGAAGAALFSFGSIALQLVADARGREDTGVALTLGVFALVVGVLWPTRRAAGT